MALALGIGLALPFMQTGRTVNPITILGDDLLEWWTADDESSLTLVGAAVSAWRGQKAGREVVQATSSARPQFSATSFNGAPGLTFDGTDDRLAVEDVFDFPTGSNGSELWGVVQQDALSSGTTVRGLVSYGGDSSDVRRGVERRAPGSTNRASATAGDGASSTFQVSSDVDLSGRHVVRGAITPTTVGIQVDETTLTTIATVPATGTSRLRIGALSNSTAANFWQGQIRDVLVTAPLTTDQANALWDWLLPRRML